MRNFESLNIGEQRDNNENNHNKMKTKSFYEAPSSELLLINFEEAFLQGTGGTTNPSTFVEDVDIDDESDQNWWGN